MRLELLKGCFNDMCIPPALRKMLYLSSFRSMFNMVALHNLKNLKLCI